VRAAKQATQTIPIVIGAVGGDPVALGLVESLARPGGNVTGSTIILTDFIVKWPQLLKEVTPRIRRCAFLLNPDNPSNAPIRLALESATKSLRMGLSEFKARGPNEFDGAFSAMVIQRVTAVMIFDDPTFNAHPQLIADLAAKRRFASVGNRDFAEAGGLMSYGPTVTDSYRRAAAYVDKILKGTNPADLPVEQATKFDLAINLKTAKMLGLSIPKSILLRADRVIE
jgi:putative tryptophan/tyrosine transport system substrate-binding protein